MAAFTFQIVLLIHFILRKWAFDKYVHQYGWIVYALAFPAAIVSVVLLRRGAEWWMWVGGFLYLAWAIFGYVVEYRLGIAWRSPINWPVFGAYYLSIPEHDHVLLVAAGPGGKTSLVGLYSTVCNCLDPQFSSH